MSGLRGVTGHPILLELFTVSKEGPGLNKELQFRDAEVITELKLPWDARERLAAAFYDPVSIMSPPS